MNGTGRLPPGMWAIAAFHLLNILLWSVGQTGALLDYDKVAGWGFQDARGLVDPVIVPAAFLVTGAWAAWYLARHRGVFR